jgi:hypothetical protein
MANIPGATNILPGVVAEITTQSRGVAVSTATRLPAIIGEGKSEFTLVANATGLGRDGLDPTYSSTTGADGRHFLLPVYPVIEGRTDVYKNGVLLSGVEGVVGTDTLGELYDYMIDSTTGKIELKSAYIVDQGGTDYLTVSTNNGEGTISSLELLTVNATEETWTVRCVSVLRDGSQQPIAGTAKFIASGSISGQKLDSYGNSILWTVGTLNSNGVLRFLINETTAFEPGDAFQIEISSGVLSSGDNLSVKVIPESYINDPVILTSLDEVFKYYGTPSTENTLSLGAQLAFSNQAPAVLCLQAAPSLPRRQSFVLTTSMVNDTSNSDNFIFPLEFAPDPDMDIHFFTTAAGETEEQKIPNKVTFYSIDDDSAGDISTFISSNTNPPSGTSNCYTVIELDDEGVIKSGFDGAITWDADITTQATFGVSGFVFDASYSGKKLKIINADNSSNNGTHDIIGVSGGELQIQAASSTFPNFTTASSLTFAVIDKTTFAPIDGYSGVDGILTASGNQATLTSASLAFSDLLNDGYSDYLIDITDGTNLNNNGAFKIIDFNGGTDTVTLKKTFITEPNDVTTTGLRYEVIDSGANATTTYALLVNKNVVADGEQLRITMVSQADANFYDAGWVNALEALETVECDIVVPLPKETISVIFQNTLSHCLAMSSARNKKERVLFCGMISGLGKENVVLNGSPVAVENVGVLEGIQGDEPTEILDGLIEDLADYSVPNSFGNTYRCVYVYPDQIIVNVNGTNTSIDGFYAAAAAAGYLAANPRVEIPLTNKTLSGFTISRSKLLNQYWQEQLANSGICLLQPVSGGGLCKWGITTTQSGVAEEQEISIVFIRDQIAKKIRGAFDGFIGLPESSETQADFTLTALGAVKSYLQQGLITDYRGLSVERDAVEPRQWNITFQVKPTYSINWVYIKVAVGNY